MNFALGFGLTQIHRLAGAVPWWHAYQTLSGERPDMVLDNTAGRSHNVTALDQNTLDLSALPLQADFSFYVRGSLQTVLNGGDFPRLIELGSASGSGERQLVFVNEADGRLRFQSWVNGALQRNVVLTDQVYPSGQTFRLAGRLGPGGLALSYLGGPVQAEPLAQFPSGTARLARAFLLSNAGGGVYPGALDQLVIWSKPLANADLVAMTY